MVIKSICTKLVKPENISSGRLVKNALRVNLIICNAERLLKISFGKLVRPMPDRSNSTKLAKPAKISSGSSVKSGLLLRYTRSKAGQNVDSGESVGKVMIFRALQSNSTLVELQLQLPDDPTIE